MHIICLGLNHQTAPVSLRERFVLLKDDEPHAGLARLCRGESNNDTEIVILTTCNRIEIYSASTSLDKRSLEALMAASFCVPAYEFRPCLYCYEDVDAVRHLLRVAAGLDSLVLGEPQILGQVTGALMSARRRNTAGPILNRLFQAAIHAGKRSRTETSIARNPASVSSLTVNLCEGTVRDIRNAQIVVIGAGEMAELAIQALRKRGVEKILVINRTLDRARELAERWGTDVGTFNDLANAVSSADILIASTGASHTILPLEMIDAAMSRRPDRPLVMFDIAVPRDIDPRAAEIPMVTLYDIDHLNAQLEHNFAIRQRQVPHVQELLAEEEAEFMDYFNTIEMLPLITNLRQKAEAIRQSELQKTLRHLPDLTEAERARIEDMTEAVVKKLLDQPTRRLRAEAGCRHASEYASMTRSLFGLESENDCCVFSGDPCPIASPAD